MLLRSAALSMPPFLIASQTFLPYFVTMRPDSKRNTTDIDKRMSCVIEYIGANLHTSSNYSRLARLANLSYSQFFREFKRRVGQSPQSYIEEQRIAFAKRLLASSRLSVKEVAFQSGFKNQLYFSRRFKKAAGMAPSQYRASCRSDPERTLHPYSYYMGIISIDRTYGSYA